jgi:hypothetical protein
MGNCREEIDMAAWHHKLSQFISRIQYPSHRELLDEDDIGMDVEKVQEGSGRESVLQNLVDQEGVLRALGGVSELLRGVSDDEKDVLDVRHACSPVVTDASGVRLVEEEDMGAGSGLDVLLHVVGLYSSVFPGNDDVGFIEKELVRVNSSRDIGGVVDRAMPEILRAVSDVVVAHVEFEEKAATSPALMGAYDGPDEWDRLLRSVEMIWIAKHVKHRTESSPVGGMIQDDAIVLLRTLALGCQDVSYRVRCACLEALEGFIDNLNKECPELLDAYGSSIQSILTRSMIGNDSRCWQATYSVVASMLHAKPSQHSVLFQEAMQQAEKNQHSLVFAACWMQAMKPCLRDIGIKMLYYTNSLLPVLLEWTQALHTDIQVDALECLLIFVEECWPRNAAHVTYIWSALDLLVTERGGRDMDERLVGPIIDIAKVLWVTCDPSFRENTRELKASGKSSSFLTDWVIQTQL